MNELNEVEKKEIEIKQHRLKTLLNIDKLIDSAAADVNTADIIDYSNSEKNNLVLDIVNSLCIDDFDEIYVETNGRSVKCSIENLITNTIKYNSCYKVFFIVYNEFVFAVATYDINDLLNYGIIHNYLKMMNVICLAYDEIDLESCKKM